MTFRTCSTRLTKFKTEKNILELTLYQKICIKNIPLLAKNKLFHKLTLNIAIAAAARAPPWTKICVTPTRRLDYKT
jgi:hypothetical protein